MKKFIAAAIALTLSTPAQASGYVMINIDRWNEIKVAAQTVCRRAMLPQNSAVQVIKE